MKPSIERPDSRENPAIPASRVLAALSLSMLLSSLGISIANVGLPSFAHAFNASFQQVQWIVLAYLLAITTLIVSAGRLGDLMGRKRLLLAGLLLFTIASLLCGLAPGLPLLIAARALQGLGAAVMMALTMAFVGDTISKARTGRAMGLLATMSAIGTALGPSLGGLLIAGPGWRAIFLINIPLGLLAALLAWRALPPDRARPETDRSRFDTAGTLLLALTLGAYALAMTIGRGRFGPLNIALLAAAILGAIIFTVSQAKAASPLVRLSLFHIPGLGSGLAASMIVATVMMTTLVVGPFYLSRALGLQAALVGLVLSAGPTVTALSGVPAGRIADRLGTRRVTIAGLAGIAFGCTLLALLPAGFGIPGYIGPVVIITVSYAMFQTANNTAIMENTDANQRGVVSGLLNLSRNLGFVTGASLMGAVFAFATGTATITSASPEAVSRGMLYTFLTAAGLIVLALVPLLASRSPWRKRIRAGSLPDSTPHASMRLSRIHCP